MTEFLSLQACDAFQVKNDHTWQLSTGGTWLEYQLISTLKILGLAYKVLVKLSSIVKFKLSLS